MNVFINTADEIGDDEMCDRIIQHTVTEYKEERITIVGTHAFAYCTELTTVDIPNVITISNYAFSNCSKLTSVNAPSATATGQATFGNCTALENVCFPSLVDVRSNGSGWQHGSFLGCTALKYVDLPVCTKIDPYAFNGCSSLTTLIIRNSATVCNLVAITAFENTPIAGGTGYIYIPSALVDSYKSATNWSTYANQFRALEEYTVDGTTTGALDESKI